MTLAPSKIALALLLLAPVAAFADLSEAEFAARFMEHFSEADPALTIREEGALHLSVSADEKREITVYLDNAYSLYLQDTEALEEVLDLYVSSLLETLNKEEKPVSQSDIVPVVKDAAWFDEVSKSMGDGEPPDYVQAAFAAGLVVFYAEDTPNSIRYIDRSVFEEIGVDMASIEELAIENMLERLPEIEVVGAEGLFMLAAGGVYEASLLLVDDIWTDTNFPVQGDIVIAIPSRDVLLISGADETEKLEDLIELTRTIHAESPYALTTTLYVRRDDEWHKF
jgi:uncharacterized protein YtpQ (UPF0354 family)